MDVRRTVVLGAFMLALLWAVPAAIGQDDPRRDSVVRIHTTSVAPDVFRPWTNRPPEESKGSGFVIDGERILTNAHVVSHAEEILIESDLLPRRVSARVEYSAKGIDLAVLRVDEPGFFDLLPAVTLGDELPSDQDQVTVLGFPMGGETLSATAGVVSRVEYSDYYYGEEGLRIQIDAAVNPGNSGGPAFIGDACIGAVFSRIDEGDNIGYVIPSKEIAKFLEDVDDGAYDGKPRLDANLATTENPGRRAKLGLTIAQAGLTVIDADDDSGLQRWDVVTAIGGIPIDDQGYGVLYGIRLRYPALIEHASGGAPSAGFSIIRDGEARDVTVTLSTEDTSLFPIDDDGRPEYFVHGPFVFAGATYRFADIARHPMWSTSLTYRQNPVALRRYEDRAYPDEQIVVLVSEPFPHPILRGHEDLDVAAVLSRVNGEEIRNLAHAYELITGQTDGMIEFEFADKHMDRFVTLDARALSAATEEVLDRHSIRKPVSAGLLDAAGE
jgi:S1-C subfamily serine protease